MNLHAALRGPADAEALDYLRQWARSYTWDSQQIEDATFAADYVMARLSADDHDGLYWHYECERCLRSALIESAEKHRTHWEAYNA